MEILLFVSLLGITCLSVKLSDYNLTNPSVLFNLPWVVSSFVYMLYAVSWGVRLSLGTYFVIVIGNLLFVIFMWLIMTRLEKRNSSTSKKSNIILFEKIKNFKLFNKIESDFNVNNENKEFAISYLVKILIAVFLIASSYYLADTIYKLSIEAGNTAGNYAEMIPFARYGTTHYKLSAGKMAANILRINYALCLVIAYKISIDLIYFKKTMKHILELTIFFIFYAGTMYLSIYSLGRTNILGMLAGTIIIFGVQLYKKETNTKKVFIKLIKYFAIIFALFILLFVIQGVFTLNRISEGNGIQSIIDNLAKYIGSPIPCLEYFMNNRAEFSSPYFGANTFVSFYGTLSHIGFSGELMSVFQPRAILENFNSNVYTVYYHYILDFGYFSIVIFQFINALVFGVIFNFVKKSKGIHSISLMIYALLGFSLVIMFFNEDLISMANTNIMKIVFGLLIYCLCMTRFNKIDNAILYLPKKVFKKLNKSKI